MPQKLVRTFNSDGTLLSEGYIEISAADFNAQIKLQLAEIDAKSIRALREGNSTRIAELETQAATLRAQLI